MVHTLVCRPLTAFLARAAFAAAVLVPAASAVQAAPLPPAGLTLAVAAPLDLSGATTVQYWGHPGWGPPRHAPAWGWRRHHEWAPRPVYGPRCTVRYVRQWDEWRGGWVTRQVRRCW